MELRSRAHLHFIRAIKGGSVKIVLNADTWGTPALKLKKLEDIFKNQISNSDDSQPKIQPRVVKGSPLDCGMIKTESPFLFTVERTIKSEPEDYEVKQNGSVRKRNRVSDDLSFGDLTLKQIREQCKSTKRKCRNQRKKETVNGDSPIKQEYPPSKPEDDGCDLEEPLSNWKSMLSKKSKGKQVLKEKSLSASSPSAQCTNKSEHIPSERNFLPNRGELPTSLNIKREVLGQDYPDCEVMTCFSTDSSLGPNKQLGSSGMESTKVPNIKIPAEEQVAISAKRQAQCCVVNEASCEYRENVDPEPVSNVSVSGAEFKKVDSSYVTDQHDSEFPVAESRENSYASNRLLYNISPENEAGYEYGADFDPKPDFGVGVSGWEIVKVDSPEILAIEYSGLHIPEFSDENHIIHALSYDISSETDFSSRDYDTGNTLLTYSSAKDDDAPWLGNYRSSVQEFDIDCTNHGLQCLDLNNMERSCESEDVAKDDLPTIPEETATKHLAKCLFSRDSDSSSRPDNCLISTEEDPSSMKRLSLSSGHVDAARDRKSIHLYNASSGHKTVTEPEGNHRKKLHCPPEKLFSGRKVISPASQEKLRKAMESDSPAKKNSKCRGKLFFSSQNAHRILKAEGLDNIKRAEVTPNSKQINRKSNVYRQASHQKSASKVPHSNIQGASPRFSTGCASVQACSQNAIAFSQRQMRDVECLANKLMKELKSMKEIMKECFQPEASPSKSSKHNVEEVRTAIENAGRAEETARKWLSVMGRDSNRFCKLMRLVGDSSGTPEKVVLDRKKKITFADEAGGDLCHVKIFEDGDALASPLESVQEKQLLH